MSRFDDPKHLEEWQAGRVPAIYQPMLGLAADTYGYWEWPLLDFACGTGILGAAVATRLGGAYPACVVGTDGNPRRLDRGRCSGIRHGLLYAPIRSVDEVTEYGRLLRHLQPRTVLMRRAIADVFEKQPQLVRQFAAELEGAGVRDLLVEGRVETRNAVNPFPTIAHEVAALAPHYHEVQRRGRLSYLEVSPA